MELDFSTIKALSSPTRIQIINHLLEKEATPTEISKDLGKSKSTVSAHLKKLGSAELVAKDEEAGRRRVSYRPTRKAQAIVEGRERKVKFSIASSVITGIGGTGILYDRFVNTAPEILHDTSRNAIGVQSKTMEKAPMTAETANTMFTVETALLGLSLVFLGISAASLIYGVLLKELGKGA